MEDCMNGDFQETVEAADQCAAECRGEAIVEVISRAYGDQPVGSVGSALAGESKAGTCCVDSLIQICNACFIEYPCTIEYFYWEQRRQKFGVRCRKCCKVFRQK